MIPTLIVCGGLLLLWVLINLKTSRPDGTLIGKIHPYRRMLPFLMKTRNESVVYFESAIDAERLIPYLEEMKRRHPIDLTHCVVAAINRGLAENPRMNQFCVGRRLYQRKERVIAFSMLRKKKDREARMAVVRMVMPDGETFPSLIKRMEEKIGVERSDKQTYTDKELSFFLTLPRPILSAGVRVFRWLDYHNLLPGGFISGDPMYVSVVLANLGSLGMGAGFHHLYEWGNCPLFLMVGKIEERAVVEDGKVVVKKILPVRFTYDERIDDGLNARFGIDSVKRCLEDPARYLGGLAEDGSDSIPLDQPVVEKTAQA
jgi:hypothetical protein